jgi:D-tyrosyl-tRNA(Tyr) deacylase
MRAVIQRVTRAKVEVGEETVGNIGAGFLVLLGVRKDDSAADVDYIADKMVNLRIFEDTEGRLNLSLLETGGEALIVSQFTLYGDARKGRRPGFSDAAGGDAARELYESVCEKVAQTGVKVERGRFAADMQVSLVNDGPVTLLLDSRREF